MNNIDVYHTPPAISFTLTVAEAKILFEDLEDVHEATTGPGISTSTVRLMAELGAELEDGGYLDEDDDDPDDTEPESNVIAVDFRPRETATDPAVKTWSQAVCDAFEKDWRRKAFDPYTFAIPYRPYKYRATL